MQTSIINTSLFVSLFFACVTSAAGIETAFESIKDSGANFGAEGAVCEQLEIVRLKTIYPEDKYIVTGGLSYSLGENTVGEIDVVVLDRNTNKAVLLEEVKCWRDLDNAMVKGTGQRDRFFWNLMKVPRQIIFRSNDGRTYSVDQFHPETLYKFVAQKGSVKKGFDVELDLTLQELSELRTLVLKCQKKGLCRRPF